MTYHPFLPNDYVEPSNSDYVKFDEWTHKLRLLTSPVFISTLREDYVDDKGKTRRRVTRKKLSKASDLQKWHKLAWLCVCYNYWENVIQLREVSQKNIRDQITTLCRDDDFGNPLAYDIKVTRKGMWQNDTSYTVQWLPKADVPEDVQKAYNSLYIDIDGYIEEWTSPFDTKDVEIDF